MHSKSNFNLALVKDLSVWYTTQHASIYITKRKGNCAVCKWVYDVVCQADQSKVQVEWDFNCVAAKPALLPYFRLGLMGVRWKIIRKR